MAISILEAMTLPIMKETKLVAGQGGVENLIKWVTIVEVLEDINRLQEGEFLITTGFGLIESEEKEAEFRKLLGQRKLSGVAIYTGLYLPVIPTSFIDVANEHNLPLIEIPSDINFSMITKAILEQIVNNQMQLIEYSLSIHKELTKLVLENKGAKEISKTLATLTSAAIIVYTDIQTIDNMVTNNIDLHILDKTNIKIDGEMFDLKEKLDNCSKISLPTHFHIQNYHVLTYPIVANNQSYGSIVAIKDSAQWREMDDIAVEHAGTVYAIEALRKVAIEETKIRLQGDLLEDIIHDHITNKAYALEQGKKLGYNLSSSQAFFYVYFKEQYEPNELQSLEPKLFQTVYEVLKKSGQPFIGRSRLESFILLVNILGKTDQEKEQNCYWIAEEIQKQWLYFFQNIPLIIGIGKCYDDINQLSQSAKEAQLAVSLSGLLKKDQTIIHYNELGMYHLLIDMKEAGIDLEKLYLNSLKPLLKHTRRQGTDLLETLEVYIYNNQNIQTTASKLFIHRHTLKYRLKQIETKTGLQLKSPEDQMRIQLAIMAYKLLNYTKIIH